MTIAQTVFALSELPGPSFGGGARVIEEHKGWNGHAFVGALLQHRPNLSQNCMNGCQRCLLRKRASCLTKPNASIFCEHS